MDELRACAIVIGLDETEDGDKSEKHTAENDARSMAEFLTGRGFRLLSVDSGGKAAEKTITGKSATKEAVTRTVKYAADHIEPGGIVIVFFAGHGFSKPEGNDPDDRAEGWSLYDDNLWDREWKLLLANFATGVRVVVVNDSCFSGGMGPPDARDPKPLAMLFDCPGARHVSRERAKRIWDDDGEYYRSLNANPKINATVLLLAASQSNQNACVGDENGLFTSRLLAVAQKNSKLSYRGLYVAVQHRFTPAEKQSPFFWGGGPHHGEFGYAPAFSVEGTPDLDGGPIPDVR